jgi:hypothetical protein
MRDAICAEIWQKILQEKIKMQEIFLAGTEKDARRESCRIVSSPQDLFHAKMRAGSKIYFLHPSQILARFISCQEWSRMQDLFLAKIGSRCTK